MPKVRTCFIALIAVVVLAPATAVAEGKRKPRPTPAAVPAQAAEECVDADLEPDADNIPRIRAAIVCALKAPPRSFWHIDIAPLSLVRLSGHGGRWTLASISSGKSDGSGED